MRAAPFAQLGLARSLLLYYARPWRQQALRRFYGELIAPGDLVFDIGAHVGNRARAAHALGARVVALEPQPLFADFLRRTMPRERMTLEQRAVGRAPGRATLNISSLHPTVSTLSSGWIEKVASTSGFRQVRWDRTVEVEVTTLDALIARHGVPDFCKIDVEGMEADILDGLSQPIRTVAFEYLPASMDVARACVERLEALGPYCFNLAEGEETRWAFAHWQDGAAALARAGELAARSGRSGDLYARLVNAPE